MFLTFRRLCLRQHLRYKIVIILVFIFLVLILIDWRNTQRIRRCFIDIIFDDKEYNKLEDVLLSTKKPTLEKSIFFHETSCSPTQQMQLNARQACAIESAAAMNPDYDIFVLFASPTHKPYNTTEFPILEALFSYKNIYFRNVNLWTYAAGTPIYEWLKKGDLFKSKFALSHISDFLRYLTLWRWGGIYLDMDVVVMKSFEEIQLNFAGAESKIVVAAGVMSFDNKGFGHELADLCLRHFENSFNGKDWGNNGPGVITRILQNICKTTTTTLMNRKRCFGFHVFEQDAFYAIKWTDWEKFFKEDNFDEVMNKTKNSYAIHVWNKHSFNRYIKLNSKVAYLKIAEKYCPRVYKTIQDYF